MIVAAIEAGHGTRAYVLEAGAAPRAFTPEGITGSGPPSPDGERIALKGADQKWGIYPIDAGSPRPLPGLDREEEILQWSADGESLYVARFGELPLRVYRYWITTGNRDVSRDLMPADRAGLVRIENVVITPDGKSYAYSHNRVLASDLFVVSGWK